MWRLLFCAALGLAAAPSYAETTLLGRYTLPSENKTYGGLSGLHISADGSSMIAVSDRSGFVVGSIVRDEDGLIADIAVADPIRMNIRLDGISNAVNDAEGVAVGDDGTIYVSFEGNHRIGQFATPTARETPLPHDAAFDAFSGNGGLEALAIDASGALFAIPERTRRRRDPFPVYRFADGAWSQPYFIPRTDAYLAVGADFGPDGLLYLLERKLSSVGFYTRVRRINLAEGSADTILETGLGVHGNMEGISVWRNASDEMIMTLIADDNYRRILNNEIAEYRIDG